MTNDVTTLTLAVDTTDVKTASQTLNQMASAGNSAAASTTRLEKANAAMVAELKRIGAGISELVKLTAAEGRAAQAVTQRSKASAAAALASTKAAAALRNEAKAVESLAPSATISAGAMQKLSLSAANVNANGVKELKQELSAAATQAARTAQAVNSISAKPQSAGAVVQQSSRSSNAEANRAAREAEREAARVQREAASAQRAADRQAAAAAVETRANARSAARSDLDVQNAKTRAAAKATRDLAEAQKAQAKAAGNAAFKNTQLGFQLQDFFVQVQAGQSPITAFIQQGSQLAGTFGGAGNAFRAVVGLITPMRVAFGLVGAAVIGLGVAFFKANAEARELNKTLQLTGNFAGQSAASIKASAAAIDSSTRATVGQAKDAAQALIATGQIGPEVFRKAAEASALFTKETGSNAQDVARDFARLASEPGKVAREFNKTFNFLSAAQLKAIDAFEKNGDTVNAQTVFYDAFLQRLNETPEKMSRLDRALEENSKLWSRVGNAIKGIFDEATINDEINKLEAQVKRLDAIAANRVTGKLGIGAGERAFDFQGTNSAPNSASADEAREALRRAQARKTGQELLTLSRANQAATQKAGDEANVYIQKLVEESKATSVLARETKNLEQKIKDAADAGTPISKADQAAARSALNKKFANPEVSQVLKAQLDKDIKSIQDILSQERDAFAFNERFLQGQYQAGLISLKDFYDARREASAQGIQAEIAVLELENQKLAEFRKRSKDPSEKIQAQTRIDENTAQISRLRAQGVREQDLLNQEASASFKQLDESVANYNATLEQLLGNEEKAAQIRASIAIQNARVLSSQKGGSVIDVGAYERALNIQTQFNEVQRRSSALAAAGRTAEEAFADAAESRGLSQRDTDSGIYKIRQLQLAQLAELTKKAQELAAASTDPAIKQFAADLAVEYAKAARAVDPALQRLKDANKEIAQSIANTIESLPKNFSDAFSRRRQEASDDIKNEKDEYNRRIDQLEQYLAESSDKQDKARLREKIKALQAEKGNLKKESRASSFFKTLGETVLAPIGQQVLSTITKVAVSDPLQKMLENSLNSLTTGEGAIGKFIRDAFGVKSDPKTIAENEQLVAINSVTTALQALEAAANSVTNALPSAGGVPSANGEVVAPDVFNPGQDEVNGILGDFSSSVQDAEAGNKDFAKAIPSVTNVLSKLTGVTSDATSALSILPSIINLISAAGASSSASSAGSGLVGLFGSFFGGGASSAASTGAASGTITNVLFHNGGIAGQGTQRRTGGVASMFDNATRYHSGGIAGLQPDEVPAILMGGPKGKREEILTAKDPRHRDNLLKPQNRPYMAGQHSAGTNNTTNNKTQQINQEFHFHTGGAPVDRRTANMAGAAVFRETARANKRYN